MKRKNVAAQLQKKRCPLNITIKYEIVCAIERGVSNGVLCKKYNLFTSTISTIKKDAAKIKNAVGEGINSKRVHLKTSPYPDMERLLMAWIFNERQKHRPVYVLRIQEKAREIHLISAEKNKSFIASNGWFQKFVKRYQVCF